MLNGVLTQNNSQSQQPTVASIFNFRHLTSVNFHIYFAIITPPLDYFPSPNVKNVNLTHITFNSFFKRLMKFITINN